MGSRISILNKDSEKKKWTYEVNRYRLIATALWSIQNKVSKNNNTYHFLGNSNINGSSITNGIFELNPGIFKISNPENKKHLSETNNLIDINNSNYAWAPFNYEDNHIVIICKSKQKFISGKLDDNQNFRKEAKVGNCRIGIDEVKPGFYKLERIIELEQISLSKKVENVHSKPVREKSVQEATDTTDSMITGRKTLNPEIK